MGLNIGDDYDDHIYHTLHTGYDPGYDHDDQDEYDYSSMIVHDHNQDNHIYHTLHLDYNHDDHDYHDYHGHHDHP